jgi:Undecaprenyl-phosphate glucose phosphotransferase
VAETLQGHRELGYQVVGFVDDAVTGSRAGLPVLGTLDDAVGITASRGVDQLYIALPLEQHARLLGLIKCVSNECVDVKVVPDVIQYATSKAALEDLDGIPIISLNEVPLAGWNSMVKRVMDVALGSAILLFLTVPVPVFPMIALLIKWKGGRGPIFYRQERMSLDGKPFLMYKFRSMQHDAEVHTGPVWAQAEDPRRTAIGVWLRRFNLDELPQLFNVVLGDMSLVGPRPERPNYIDEFRHDVPGYMLRHKVRAGMTGWAQVHGWRGDTSIHERVEHDLYYIQQWSFWLDLRILVMTLFRRARKSVA